ncbi:putative nuclease HARBI1, partial [Trifolium medium]|nr:putative nuclease HARBI1 [Trifolium medium]
MASVLSYVASTRTPSSPSNNNKRRKKRRRNPNASDYSVAAFRALSTEHIWS